MTSTFTKTLGVAASAAALILALSPAAAHAAAPSNSPAPGATNGKGGGQGLGRCTAPGRPPVPSNEGTVLYFQDAHEFSPRPHANDVQRGSISRLATVLADLTASNHSPATIFGGDLAGGTLFGGIYKGVPFVEAFNELGVDVATFGQHDFDFGTDHTRDLVAASEFEWIASNIEKHGGEPFLPGQTVGVVKAGDLRIGVIGLTGSLKNSSANAELTQTGYVDASRTALSELESRDVDVVVASAQIDRADAEALMAEVPEIQIIMREEDSAAAQADVTELENERLIVTGMGDYGAVLEIDIAADLCGRITTDATVHAVDQAVEREPKWFAVEQAYEADLSNKLDTVVGESTAALTRPQIAYTSADGLRSHFNADLGWINGGGIRANLDAGPITLRELHAIHPYSNTGMLIQVTGTQLVDALNQGADSNPTGSGGFPQPSGFTYSYTPGAPQGQRITDVRLTDGTPVSSEATYSLAITNYVAVNGGDGVTALQNAAVMVTPDEGIADNASLIAYVEKLGTINPQAPRVEIH
ncbi:bifunctional metallophosphatase/5'-nucleotidase [Pseudarthrobacter sp. H2]|uniref:bifunctional metallophosphatase/5'-nucleotidase n=1 Tax=Pseudarthrobacter sp. H2 TaxID=3418415 RepID=UPI003CEF3FCB